MQQTLVIRASRQRKKYELIRIDTLGRLYNINMRKIDPHEYMRFMKAMKLLTKEMNKLHQKDVAGEVTMQGNELKAIYRKHCRLIEQLEESTELYFDTFTRAHSVYREASRLKSRIKTKAREAAKQLAREEAAKKKQGEEKKQRA